MLLSGVRRGPRLRGRPQPRIASNGSPFPGVTLSIHGVTDLPSLDDRRRELKGLAATASAAFERLQERTTPAGGSLSELSALADERDALEDLYDTIADRWDALAIERDAAAEARDTAAAHRDGRDAEL